MKTTLTIVLFIISTLHAALYPQVTIEGNLLLGDTSQILILQTKNGDQLVGSIFRWDADSLLFKLAAGNLMRYSMSDVDKLKVHSKPLYSSATDLYHGRFTILSDDGIVRGGHIINMDRWSARIKHGKNKRAYIRGKKLEEVIFNPLETSYKYDNTYRIRLKKGGKYHGHLLHIDKEYVRFQPIGGTAQRFSRSQVKSITHKKGYQPMNGHQRTLFLMPNGFNLRKGESEFRDIDYFLNSFSTGINDHLSGTVGLIGIEPYFQLKASHDIGPLMHVSAGASISLVGAAGWYMAASLGTADQYLNFGYMQNKGKTIIDDTDMNAVFAGGSTRLGNRQRLFCEFIHLIEKKSLLDANGYGTNTFAFGYGWFGRRVSFNMGLMLVEAVNKFNCFGSFGPFPCNEENYLLVPIPVISTSIYFGKMNKDNENNRRTKP